MSMELQGNFPYRLETKDLSYKLCSNEWSLSTSNSRVILQNVNIEARSGEMTAIVGPSGAGKTTLLEILAGKKVRRREISGQVLVNNKVMDVKHFRRLSGYVTQEDALFPLLTVEETLLYSALFRLPGVRKDAEFRVKKLLNELGLDHVARSRIGGGSGNGNGVSGGERRRVSIGVELVHDPSVILTDEPTSGLDSGSALQIVEVLKSMSNRGKTVILTIHQPGFRILELVDRVVLLSNGYVMHNGSLDLLEERLTIAGHQVPLHVNVVEYAIDVVESLDIQNMTETAVSDNVEDDQGLIIELFTIVRQKPIDYSNSRFDEVLILGQRFCKNIFRTKQLFATKTIQSLVVGFLLGTLFLNIGQKNGPVSLQTETGFFAFSLTFLLSSTTEGLPIFLDERRIVLWEIARGGYRISSYVLSNTFVFTPFLLMVTLLYSTPVYWLVGLRRDVYGFSYFSLVVWLVSMMSNSLVMCFSALVPNFIMGTSVIAGLMGSFFLFSGYFISKKNIPSYWIFMHYLSLFKYPFECFLINEYGDEKGQRKCLQVGINGDCSFHGSDFLRQQDLEESQKWSNIVIMLGFIIGYRLLCFCILWFRCYKTTN